jgi:ankyrin repeat protein
MASQNGHTDVVKALVEKGADTDIRAADGSTALMIAIPEWTT